jgi:hypothetical protein
MILDDIIEVLSESKKLPHTQKQLPHTQGPALDVDPFRQTIKL